jgi:hypothetical protein
LRRSIDSHRAENFWLCTLPTYLGYKKRAARHTMPVEPNIIQAAYVQRSRQ